MACVRFLRRRSPTRLRAPIHMSIALLVGSVANFPVLWYDKFDKLKFALHKVNYIAQNLYTHFLNRSFVRNS